VGKRIRSLVAVLALTILTAAAFSPVANNGFVSIDDPSYIVNNHFLEGGLSAGGVRWAFTTYYAGNWHPLTWLSHMADRALYGLEPRGHHLTNLGLHCLNAAVLFAVLQGLTGAFWRSLAVAALFAVHPLHVESVAWVSERKDLLCAGFTLGALGWYGRCVRRPGPGAGALVALFMALALLAKPMAVTLPFLLLLLDWWPLGRYRANPSPGVAAPPAGPRSAASLLAEKIPLFALATASSFITARAQQSADYVQSLDRYSFPTRVANALVAYAQYLRKTVWPDDLAVPYGHPGENLPLAQVLIAVLLLGALTYILFAAARRAPYLATGWLWFGGMLVPVVGLVQVADQAMADRYTYLPLVGVFVALAWGSAELWKRVAPARGALAATWGGAVLLCAGLTFVQCGYWRDDARLLTHAVAANPGNWLACDNLGIFLARQQRYDEAAALYDELLRRGETNRPAVYNNLGVLDLRRRRYADAERHLRRAIELRPAYGRAYAHLGILEFGLGRFGAAVLDFENAIRYGDASPENFEKLEKTLERAGVSEGESASRIAELMRAFPPSQTD